MPTFHKRKAENVINYKVGNVGDEFNKKFKTFSACVLNSVCY